MAKIKNKKTKFKKSNLRNIDMRKFEKIGQQVNRRIFEDEYRKMEQDIEKLKIQKTREMTQSVFQELFVNLLGIPLLALRNKGWGEKRLSEFYSEMMVIFKDFHEQWFTSDDMAQAIKDETGFDLLADKEAFIEWMKTVGLQEQVFVYSSDENVEDEQKIVEKIKGKHNE